MGRLAPATDEVFFVAAACWACEPPASVRRAALWRAAEVALGNRATWFYVLETREGAAPVELDRPGPGGAPAPARRGLRMAIRTGRGHVPRGAFDARAVLEILARTS